MEMLMNQNVLLGIIAILVILLIIILINYYGIKKGFTTKLRHKHEKLSEAYRHEEELESKYRIVNSRLEAMIRNPLPFFNTTLTNGELVATTKLVYNKDKEGLVLSARRKNPKSGKFEDVQALLKYKGTK